MAKGDAAAEAAPATSETAAATATPAASRAISVRRPKTMTHPMSEEAFKAALDGETESQPRAAFIRELWATFQYTRSQITSLVRLAQGDPNVKYQIIFQATKGQEGGEPAKTPATAATEAATAAA